MKRKINKKGSHVGVVLSFVVFITFLIFLYSTLEPAIKTDRDKQFVLDYLEKEFIKNFSNDLTLVTISLNETYNPQSNCINISHVNGVSGMNLIVKNEQNAPVKSNNQNNSIEIDINETGEQKKFFKIYYSEEYFSLYPKTNYNSCDNSLEGSNYSIGLFKTDNYIFESKILKFLDIYNYDYEKLRNELNIPLGSDFGFNFKNKNGIIIGTGEKNLSASIYVNEISIQYIDNEANIGSGSITIKAW